MPGPTININATPENRSDTTKNYEPPGTGLRPRPSFFDVLMPRVAYLFLPVAAVWQWAIYGLTARFAFAYIVTFLFAVLDVAITLAQHDR